MLSPNSEVPGFDPASISLVLLGAVVLLWPYKVVLARRRAETTEDLSRFRRGAWSKRPAEPCHFVSPALRRYPSQPSLLRLG